MNYETLAEEFLQICLKSSYVRVSRELSNAIKPGIFILLYLKKQGGKAYPKDLSNEFIVSSARIAALLNKLEDEKYIQRYCDEKDNRQTIVQLSEKGEALIVDKRNEIVHRLSKMLELLGSDDAEEYIRLQKKLCQAINESF